MTPPSTDRCAASLNALGDPTRRAIVERLRQGPAAVGEIAAGLPVSRPAVSKHLRVLEASRLVTHVEAGNRNLYRIDPVGLEAVRDYLDSFWTEALGAFAAYAASAGPAPAAHPLTRSGDRDDHNPHS